LEPRGPGRLLGCPAPRRHPHERRALQVQTPYSGELRALRAEIALLERALELCDEIPCAPAAPAASPDSSSLLSGSMLLGGSPLPSAMDTDMAMDTEHPAPGRAARADRPLPVDETLAEIDARVEGFRCGQSSWPGRRGRRWRPGTPGLRHVSMCGSSARLCLLQI
jgi:hypothetical protein